LSAARGRSIAVHYWILALLTGFSLVSYMLRTNITVAAQFMKPDLGLDDVQMGRVFSAFMLGYAIFQIPAGVLGDRWGARAVLSGAAALWGVVTVLTGVVPGLLVGTGLAALTSLLILRFTLGVAEAATYPVAAQAVANWMPLTQRTFANAVVIAGASLGIIAASPLVAWMMVSYGWRATFFVTAALGFGIAVLWRWYATDRPANHRDISPTELSAIVAGRTEAPEVSRTSWWHLLRSRNMRLICLSYFLDSFVLFIFVFWFFQYLIEERGFSVLRGGVFNSLPYIFALVMVPLVGRWCDALSARRGRERGRRAIAILCLCLSAVFLLVGATVAAAVPAILCLSLSVGFLQSTEGPFWSSATDIAGRHAATAGGIMNTAGNLGGVVSTALAPVAVQSFGWAFTFAGCGVLLLVASVSWIFIKHEQ
jgi:ACS family glucarate transporter-like MFS transporter